MRPDGAAFYANLFCHVMMSMSNATSWQDCYFGHLSTVEVLSTARALLSVVEIFWTSLSAVSWADQ